VCGAATEIFYYDEQYLENMDVSGVSASDISHIPNHYKCKSCGISFGKCLHCNQNTIYTSKTFFSALELTAKNNIEVLLRRENLEFEISEHEDISPDDDWYKATITLNKPYSYIHSQNISDELVKMLRIAEFIHDTLFCQYGCEGSFHRWISTNG
jgi:hypothetical protein